MSATSTFTRATRNVHDPVLKRYCRESYNDRLALYETLKRRGMHIVTVRTTIPWARPKSAPPLPRFLRQRGSPGTLPAEAEAHIAVYDITERQHVEIQARTR